MNGFSSLPKRGLYRSRTGLLLGVCKGLAQYFDISLLGLRLIFLVLLILSGIWPVVGIYLVAFLLMKPEPVKPIINAEEQDFYDNYMNSRQRALRMLKRRYENMEHRLRRIEDKVTSREFEWDRKIKT